VRIPENTERVQAATGRGPRRSVRRHSVALNLSSTSLRRILQYNLHFHPYKLHIVQELSDRDFAYRSVFCEQFFFTFPNENPGVVRHLIMSDEAHFQLFGCVNTQRVG
jgi:hypothetical protein